MSVYFTRRGPAPALGKRASDYAVGDIVKLRENGQPVEYLVVHQGLPGAMYDPSCDGTWVLRKDIAEERVWAANNVNKLETSDIQAYLNNTWINRYDAATQSAIKQVKIPYRQNGGSGGTDQTGENGLHCKGFLLAGYEVGFTTDDASYLPVDGVKLAYFESGVGPSAKNKRIAKLNESADYWWLRSQVINGQSSISCVSTKGVHIAFSADASKGIRPAHILRPDTLFDPETNILKG